MSDKEKRELKAEIMNEIADLMGHQEADVQVVSSRGGEDHYGESIGGTLFILARRIKERAAAIRDRPQNDSRSND